tara:strand:+ start:490 stop:1758 length:1269 start_codon:yes stop_codon:yes gene_type:complete
MHKILGAIFFSLALLPTLNAQVNNHTISVYLDCRGCSESFIQSEISFVNFVRDQALAEVHLLITNQRTGGGGRQYTLEFIGQNEISGINSTLSLNSPESDTEEERRNKLTRYIKLGFVSYLSDSEMLSNLDLVYKRPTGKPITTPEYDPWNNWIIEFGGDTRFSGEETKYSLDLNGYTKARRITENWKTSFEYYQHYKIRSYTTSEFQEITPGDSADVQVTNRYTIKKSNFFGLIGKSLTDHWSIGVYSRLHTSTQDNFDLSIGATPAIEFSLFPYDEFTRREVTFRLGLLTSYNDYAEETIFNETSEVLFKNELEINAEFTQPWGGIEGGIDVNAYLHDLSKNRFEFNARLDMRVFRGFTVFMSGRYSVINDQLSLPLGDASSEEVLLNLRSQSTSYNYGGSVGFSITFGSIYNNAINPRL